MPSASDESIEYRYKTLKAALCDISKEYCDESGSRHKFVFIEQVGFAEVVPAGGKRVRKGLQAEIVDARALLGSLVECLSSFLSDESGTSIYNSVTLRRLIKTSQVAYRNISHRMMYDLLSVSPKGFTIVSSLYSDIGTIHKIINAVRYGETDPANADGSVRKLGKRIVAKAAKATDVFKMYENHVGSQADAKMFGKHNIMAYRYRSSFYLNVELIIEYLGLDPDANKWELARDVREMSAAVKMLLGTVERSDSGVELELVSR